MKAPHSKVLFRLAALLLLELGLAASSGAAEPASLKTAFGDCFLIGAALNEAQFSGRNPEQTRLIAQQFNTISPENALKWASVQPRPGQFDFSAADRYVAFGREHGMRIIGHTLIWHQQTPSWVFTNSQGRAASREELLACMSNHIHTVVARYKGRIQGWDVVNEALEQNGRLRDSPWRRLLGDDYLLKAFQFAHQADPQAELYYNDYLLEQRAKRAGAVRIVKELQAAGIPLTAVGLQSHSSLTWPAPRRVDATIRAFARLGVKVMITELDMDVLPRAARPGAAETTLTAPLHPELNPYSTGLPERVQQQLARRYAELFAVYLNHRRTITRVTFWGVSDADSWLNDWPVRGRTAYPLLFDRANRPKPAFEAVLATAARQQQPPSIGLLREAARWAGHALP